MGFTIQDMLITSQLQYQMKMIAGNNGWSNSISWIMMVEDLAILNNFSGKELVVTTGLGFDTEDKLLELSKHLVSHHASGLIINTGEYIKEIPQKVISFCNENDLPLLDVPWEIYLADMIKDLSIHIFMQGSADDQITSMMIKAIENPDNQSAYRKELLPYYDVDGTFQVVLFSTDKMDAMDTVERKKLSYRLQIYLENITHNGNFFYYDGDFVLVTNDITEEQLEEILVGMLKKTKKRMQDQHLYIGKGSQVKDITNLYLSYQRALSAIIMAKETGRERENFDEMGMYRLLYSVKDKGLLWDMMNEALAPIIEYDKKHNSNYLETLESYLKHNGSIQAISEELFTHRNTVIYRVNNIKKLLNSKLDSSEDKIKYQIAYYIRNMRL